MTAHDEPDDPAEMALRFEQMYAAVGEQLGLVAWASLGAHPRLIAWLDEHQPPHNGNALVVGCGLGDDAEELDKRGYDVTAFDVSATAIHWCGRRFPNSGVDYQVHDIFHLPTEWDGRYDVVAEVNTIQSIPPSGHTAAIAAIARTVSVGGRLFVKCLARNDDEPANGRPWAVSLAELAGFESAGLRQVGFLDAPGMSGRRSFDLSYVRPS